MAMINAKLEQVLTGVTATSDAYAVFPDMKDLFLAVRPTAAGSCTIQYTTDSKAEIDAETAEWRDSGSSTITSYTELECTSPISAWRIAPTSGTWKVVQRQRRHMSLAAQ